MATIPDFTAQIAAYIEAADADAEVLLDRLCRTMIYPLALRLVRSKLASGSSDVHDVVQEVVSRLALELRQMRVQGAHRVTSAVGWVAASALNACYDRFREGNRPRTQLSNAVRYILRHSIVFRLWDDAGRRVCGWYRCIGTPALPPGRLSLIMRHETVMERAARLDVTDASTIRRLLSGIFALAHASVAHSSLVPAIVDASGLPGSILVDAAALPEPVAGGTADEAIIQESLLRFFWAAAMTLPWEQRLALLMHLSGRDGIQAFWEHGAIARKEAADTLSLTDQQLNELPWTDLQIADFIDRGGVAGPTPAARPAADREAKARRQRVINWRRDARKTVDSEILGYLRGATPRNLRASSTSSTQKLLQ